PTTWAKPWTAEIPWTKTKGPLYESACHEGNNMIVNILRGPVSPKRKRPRKGNERKGVTHENKAGRHRYCSGFACGGGSGVGASRVCGRIRSEQTDQGARIGREVGIDQSALLDSH